MENIEFALRSKAYLLLLASDISTNTKFIADGNGPRLNMVPGKDYFGFMEDAIKTYDAGIECRPVLQYSPLDKIRKGAYQRALHLLPQMSECDWCELADHQRLIRQELLVAGSDVNLHLAEQVFMSLRAPDAPDYETKSHIAHAQNAVNECELHEASVHIARARLGVDEFRHLREGYSLVKRTLNAVKMLKIIADDITAGKAIGDFTVAATRMRDFKDNVGYLPQQAHNVYVNMANIFKK
jgi:hypothetical protein